MPSYKCQLIVDSCCDLPFDLIDREGITLLRFPYIVDGGTFDDDLFQSISSKDFYGAMRKGAEPSTSQLTVPILEETFTKVCQLGEPVVYLSFTSGMSGSYDVACLVRDQLLAEHPDWELYVVDTKLASIAEGFLVLEAMKQWEHGMDAQELVKWVEEARNYVNCQFMVEDLIALKRGGRIPGSVAVAGAALDVKPLLTIDVEGRLQLTGVARGCKKGIKSLLDCFERNHTEGSNSSLVVIGSSDAPKDMMRLRDGVLKVDDTALIVECSIGPVIGSHVGPEMLAIVFWGQDKRETLSVADRIARRVKRNG